MSLSVDQGVSDSHLLLLYRDEPERRVGVTSWVKEGLDRGEMIFYSHELEEPAFLAALAEVVVDAPTADRRGQLVFVGFDEYRDVAGQRGLVEAALAKGYPAVRVSARVRAVVAGVGLDNYASIEMVTEDLCNTLPVSALCQYDLTWTSGPDLDVVVAVHPDEVIDGQLRLRGRGGEVAVRGETDVQQVPTVTGCLRAACARAGAGGTLTIDASAWDFADVAGCRAVVAGTEHFRRAGGVVLLRGVQPKLWDVMQMLHLDRLPGIRLEGTGPRG